MHYYGIRDTALNWFMSYLTKRTQCNSVSSSIKEIETGVHLCQTRTSGVRNVLRYHIPELLNRFSKHLIDKMKTHSMYLVAHHITIYLINLYCYECNGINCYICNKKMTVIIGEPKYCGWPMIAGCCSVFVVTHTGARYDLVCSIWLCFRIGYKITKTMNYLYSAFFCPPCQSLHARACLYICDICICIYIYLYTYIYICPDDCNKLSSIIIIYHVCETEVTEIPQ